GKPNFEAYADAQHTREILRFRQERDAAERLHYLFFAGALIHLDAAAKRNERAHVRLLGIAPVVQDVVVNAVRLRAQRGLGSVPAQLEVAAWIFETQPPAPVGFDFTEPNARRDVRADLGGCGSGGRGEVLRSVEAGADSTAEFPALGHGLGNEAERAHKE